MLTHKGFQKGHPFYKGGEKGWFEKGIVPPTCFKKGFTPWNKGIKTGLIPKTAFKKGEHISPKTEFEKGVCGEKSGHWKGGISPLHTCIKGLEEYKKWRNGVFGRDNYLCVDCFKGGKIHVHHIKTFSELLEGFLKEYSQFSPIEDKETLTRLAVSYSPFWDVDNGQTLCIDCHKKTDSYLRGRK